MFMPNLVGNFVYRPPRTSSLGAWVNVSADGLWVRMGCMG